MLRISAPNIYISFVYISFLGLCDTFDICVGLLDTFEILIYISFVGVFDMLIYISFVGLFDTFDISQVCQICQRDLQMRFMYVKRNL